MDLREKPGKVQTFVEFLRRFRLIFLIVLIPLFIVFMPPLFDMVSYVLGAAENFAMQKGSFLASENLLWFAGAVLCLFILRYFFFGASGLIALFWSILFVPALLILLNGSDEVILALAGGILAILLVLTVLIKSATVCVFVPVYLSLLAVTALAVTFDFSYFVWKSFAVLAIADLFSFGFSAGKLLREGTPKDGALLRVYSKQIYGIFFSALTVSLFFAFPMILAGSANTLIAESFIPFGFYFAWMTLIIFPLLTLAPFGRLRAEKRRVKLTDKKTAKAEKKK
ncbi:MAG: hypothetical protein LBR60_07250 [Fibrobacter sp.]|jgi:hypothetical protein|nr:hypothetical protein [Fibrobacter sp.]